MGIRRKGKQSVHAVLSCTDISRHYLPVKFLQNFVCQCWIDETYSLLMSFLVTKDYLSLFFLLNFGAFITTAVARGE